MNSEIRNAQGEKIDYHFHDAGGDRVVVIGHGVTGNKDRPLVAALAAGLAAAGVSALRFSFAGNGDSEGDFGAATISKEVGDLGAVIDALAAAGKSVFYVGHSMGGAVGVLRAGADERIEALVSLAGMVDTKKFAETEFGDVTPGAGTMWDDDGCPLSQAFMDDLGAIGSLVENGAAVRVPWLLVHGTEDDVVPLRDTLDIFERAGGSKRKILLEGCGHVFDEPAHLAAMVDGVVAWVKELP